jgi:nucleoside-diphosphate-sugar epimerase
MENKKILIIGGNGYVGSRLYESLLKENYDVDNLDLCWFGKLYDETIVKDYRDLTDSELSKYTHIILLAGHSSVSMSKDNNFSCISNNVSNFVSLVEKLSDEQILLYASTLAVYGANPKHVTEQDELMDAKNIYDYTFIAREDIAKLYPTKKLVGLRFGSVNGFSKNFRNENIINALSSNIVTNNELVVSNGHAYRSILGITDLSRCFIRLIESNKILHSVYNLTSLNDTILNIAQKIHSFGNSNLTINESSFQTDYSFNCSSKLFETEFNFKFIDSIDSIFDDVSKNFNNIVFNKKREKKHYV